VPVPNAQWITPDPAGRLSSKPV